jgi:hypothetical protein
MDDQPATPTAIVPPEERLRLDAAERLSAMMALSLRLLGDCGMHTAMNKSDAVGALNAAARLIKSNADITHALVRAAQGETRHRSITEKTTGLSGGLNPNFSGPPSDPHKGALEEFQRRIHRLVAAKEAEESGKPYPFEEHADDDADS